MSIEKSELKKSVLTDIGADVEDMLDGAKAQANEQHGAKSALRAQAAKLKTIIDLIQKDTDEGKFSGMSELEFSKYSITQVQRCIDATIVAAQHAENLEIASQGALSFAKSIVERISKKVSLENGKISVLSQMQDGDELDGRTRPTGVRPGLSIAMQRKAEEEPVVKQPAKKKRESKKKVS